MPTGSGKSYVEMAIAREWVRGGGHATILVPSEEVVQQLKRLAWLLGLTPVIEMADLHASRFAPFVIGTYQTMWRRVEKYKRPKSLVLLDECHHVNFDAPVNLSIASAFERAIGFSATPWSSGCESFFGDCSYCYPLSRSIAESVNCDFAVLPWMHPTPGKYQVVYCSNMEHILDMCRQISPSAYAVYQAENARQIIARFRHGLVGTIVVNRMLTEGFDQPQIKRVWIARDTESDIFALQMAGRALRPYQRQQAAIHVRSERTRATLEQAIRRAG
jgi:superfamily II DNA or RNA helicase